MTSPYGALSAFQATTGTQADAKAIIQDYLNQYNLGNLATWAWGQITNSATADQILVNMYATPEFNARFPAIAQRAAAGLPPISPSDYLTYEDNAKQIENTYGMPTGFLSNPNEIAGLLTKDVSVSELTDRANKGFQAVTQSPPETRQAFTAMFGVNGDGALAAHFLDPKVALPLLEKQATMAQIGGQAAMNGIDVSQGLAAQMANVGVTGPTAQTGLADLTKRQDLYQASATEQPGQGIGTTGVEAQFGLSAQAEADTIAREQARTSQFKGGGGPTTDQYGAHGAGPAKPM